MGYGLNLSRGKLFSLVLVALVTGSLLGGILWNLGGDFTFKSFATFASEQELVDFLKTSPANAPQSLTDRIGSFVQGFSKGGTSLILPNPNAVQTYTFMESGATEDYSKTNIQVEGVDEVDIVKSDGKYLYLASGSVIYILLVYPAEDAKLLSKIELNMTVVGLYINGDKLVSLLSSYSYSSYRAYFYYYPSGNTSINVYDVSTRSIPTLDRDLKVDGGYVNSRMIGNYVYVIVNKAAYVVDNSTVTLPVISVDGSATKIEAQSVYKTGLYDYAYFFTSIIALNIKNPEEKPTVESFLMGSTSTIFVSAENIYLTSYAYTTPSGTRIYKIGVKDGSMSQAITNSVAGYVLNQYSMDEDNGYFRIVTSDGKSTSITIFDTDLKIVGKLEGLAPGEYLHSARFMGKRCYLITFKKTDPLFVIDLEDPKNPRILGLLKIPWVLGLPSPLR